jgi:ubiquinone/menaquinone biosynthesis C-methylase UbiE
MSVHEAASRGFDRGADAYERGRPSYPEQATAWLADELGLAPGKVLVDVGAGTGKLTRTLVSSGAELIAVEPVAGMRAVLAREVPQARILEGTAETLPLEHASADAIVVAQAFHWFDGPQALAEFHRVLRPRGRLALVWNRRDENQQLQSDLQAIIDRYRGSTPRHGSDRWRAVFEDTTLFALSAERTRPFQQSLDVDGLVDRVTSISFVAALDQPELDKVAERVRALAAGGLEPLAYLTEIFIYDRLPSAG